MTVSPVTLSKKSKASLIITCYPILCQKNQKIHKKNSIAPIVFLETHGDYYKIFFEKKLDITFPR
jgi:hypothetical protein